MTIENLLLGAAVAAVILAVIRLGVLLPKGVQSEIVNRVILKFGEADQWDRALKICRAATGTPYCEALADVIKTFAGPTAQEHSRQLISGLPALFEESFAERAKQYVALQGLSWLAALLIIMPAVHWLPILRTMRHSHVCMEIFGAGAFLIIASELYADYMRRVSAAAGAALMAKVVAILDRKVTAEPRPS